MTTDISDTYLEIVVKIFRLNFLSYRTQNIYQSWDSPSFFPLSCQKHYIITRTNDAFIIKWVALLNSDCPVNKKGKKKGEKKKEINECRCFSSFLIDMLIFLLNLDYEPIPVSILSTHALCLQGKRNFFYDSYLHKSFLFSIYQKKW